MSLYFVFLRQPTIVDRRNDPFWEFGSFGKTGCHRKNLLHPKRSPLEEGDQLAFLQGGRGELRIIGITPPIALKGSISRIEIKWDPSYRPLPYSSAPILINNEGETDFPEVKPLLADTNRSTWCGAAGSRFRSRTTPVNTQLSDQIMDWFSDPGRPKIKAYPEAIVAESNRWYQIAFEKGWATIEERQRQYENLDK